MEIEGSISGIPRNRNAYTTTPQWIQLQVMFSFYILIVTNLTVNES